MTDILRVPKRLTPQMKNVVEVMKRCESGELSLKDAYAEIIAAASIHVEQDGISH